MRVDDLVGQQGEWLKGTGPESDIVLSTRIRLARNLARYPFLTVAPIPVRADIEKHVRGRFDEVLSPRRIDYLPITRMNQVDRTFLFERHLISREHAAGEGERGVALSSDESVSIMVNEEDHLRIQVLRSGLQLDEAYDQVDKLDTLLAESLHFAFSPRFGYLTACPTNVGTGMRVSVMLHLPAVVFSKQVDQVVKALTRLNYAVRGLYGEGTQPLGDFFQISNQVTLGKSERDILDELRKAIPRVLGFEREWRHKLRDDKARELEDRIWRAFGILRHARTITSEETVELLSAVRLGVYLGVLGGIALTTLNELFIVTQPSHLQKLEKRLLSPSERDEVRADYVRRRLEASTH